MRTPSITGRRDEPRFVNPSDWTNHFWKHNYRITLDFGAAFWVNADCEGDALDFVIDFCEIHYPGFVACLGEISADEMDEYYIGGNHGLALTSDYVNVEEV